MESLLHAVRRFEKTDVYVNRLLDALFRIGDASTVPLEQNQKLIRAVRNLKVRFPGVFRILIVDRTGRTMEGLSDAFTGKAVVQKMYKDLLRYFHDTYYTAGDEAAFNQLKLRWPLYKAFIGPNADLEALIGDMDTLHEVRVHSHHRYFSFRLSGKIGIFVHASHVPDWEFLALRDVVRRVGLFHPKSAFAVGVEPVSETAPAFLEISRALQEFRRTAQPKVLIGPRQYYFMAIAPTVSLWATRQAGFPAELRGKRLTLLLAVAGIFGLLAWQSYLALVLGRGLVLSIRWRLILLFAFASGIPLSLVLFAQWDYLAQLREGRVRRSYDECERVLQTFDGRFALLRNRIENEIKTLISRAPFPETQERQDILTNRLLQMVPKLNIDEVFLFKKDGTFLWSNTDPRKVDTGRYLKLRKAVKKTGGVKILGELVRSMASEVNEESIGSPLNTAEMISSSMFGGVDLLRNVARKMGIMAPLSYGSEQKWILINPIGDADGKISYAIVILWKKFFLEQLYLLRFLLETERSLPYTRLIGVCPTRSNPPTPPDSPVFPLLKGFLKGLQLQQGTLFNRISRDKGKETLLLTGIKGKELSEHYLMAVRSDREITKEIADLKRNLWALMAGILFVVTFLGIILGRRFLTPIGFLTSGVRAMESRNFHYRLPAFEKDELGRLAEIFNQVMEGMADLEVAKIVQESLFPAGDVSSGEYQVFGVSQFASELGGDYFDLKKLEDGRIFCLIGDVSGHGVPAALIMAMAKALIEHHLPGDFSLESIITAMNNVLFRTLKRKRMMSCIIGLVSPDEHLFRYINAGHNYPFAISPGKPARFLKNVQSYPLGARKNPNFEVNELPTLPGDKVFLYTDGIVETKTRSGLVGYDGLQQALPGLMAGTPQEAAARILAWNKGLNSEQVQEDDISVLIISRSAIADASKGTL